MRMMLQSNRWITEKTIRRWRNGNSKYSHWICNDEKLENRFTLIWLKRHKIKLSQMDEFEKSKIGPCWNLWLHSTAQCHDHRNRITCSMWDANWFIRNVLYTFRFDFLYIYLCSMTMTNSSLKPNKPPFWL